MIVFKRSQDQEDVRKDNPLREVFLKPLRILVAEDNVVNQRLAERLLKKNNHDVTIAQNGQTAIDKHESEVFDLILMDVQMPIVDGFEATRIIRAMQDKSLQQVPIIAMTANAMMGDRERCIDAGMNGYVSKPIQVNDLFAEINRVLGDMNP